jgi:hypothetical protein
VRQQLSYDVNCRVVTHLNRNSAALLRFRKSRAMLQGNTIPFKRMITRKLSQESHLTETYCPVRGSLVAATPRLELLEPAEKMHICPQSRAFARG